MADNDQLKPNDFPVHAEKKKIVKTDGKDIAEATTPKVAEDIADRLNSEEAQREQDRWA
jgi:gamma-glutamyl phosphate reductase